MEDEIAFTREPADDNPTVIEAVSVAVPIAADSAPAVADFSAKLEMRYDGKRNTVAMRTANETKKSSTMRNLT